MKIKVIIPSCPSFSRRIVTGSKKNICKYKCPYSTDDYESVK